MHSAVALLCTKHSLSYSTFKAFIYILLQFLFPPTTFLRLNLSSQYKIYTHPHTFLIMYPSTDQYIQYPPRPVMAMDRPWKANTEVAPNCPRCASTNTKFCYYNNYSLTQPRYFCKGCRRYWTKGGSLRNVPVGGGCRKSRRARSTRSSSMPRGLHGSDGRSTSDPFLNSSSDSDCSRTDPVDIDLAAVFAKFLNPNSSSGDNQNTDGSDKFTNSESDNTVTIDSQPQEPFDLVDRDAPLLNEIPQANVDYYNQQEGRIEEIVDYQLPSSLDSYNQQERRIEEITDYDVPPSFNDRVQDVFWSDTSDATAYSSFPWQPMAPLQEFDPSPVSLQNQSISTDLLNDNWNCFDLPVCDVFLRP